MMSSDLSLLSRVLQFAIFRNVDMKAEAEGKDCQESAIEDCKVYIYILESGRFQKSRRESVASLRKRGGRFVTDSSPRNMVAIPDSYISKSLVTPKSVKTQSKRSTLRLCLCFHNLIYCAILFKFSYVQKITALDGAARKTVIKQPR